MRHRTSFDATSISWYCGGLWPSPSNRGEQRQALFGSLRGWNRTSYVLRNALLGSFPSRGPREPFRLTKRLRIPWGSNPHALADILFSRQVPSPSIGWGIHSLINRDFRAFTVAVGCQPVVRVELESPLWLGVPDPGFEPRRHEPQQFFMTASYVLSDNCPIPSDDGNLCGSGRDLNPRTSAKSGH
jgi:hypothetical protein